MTCSLQTFSCKMQMTAIIENSRSLMVFPAFVFGNVSDAILY